MIEQPVTLIVGSDSDSDEAIRAVEGAGILLHIVNSTLGERDFETPLLVNAWGVFEGLDAIIWFTRVATEHYKMDIVGAPSIRGDVSEQRGRA